MRNTKRFVSVFAGLLAVFLGVSSLAAQEPVVVRVTPATLALAVDNASDVAVEIVDVEGLYGFDIQMTFDPAIVEVVDADPNKPGTQVSLGRMLEPGMSVRDGADNTTGVIHYAMTQLNPSEAKSGTGNLIVVKLRGKAAGNSDLTITSVDLARRDASAIEASPQPGAVTVTVGASTQPTNTPIPTQAPPTAAPTGLPGPTVAQAAAAQPVATDLPSATPTEAPPTATTGTETPLDTPTPTAETTLPDPTVTSALPDPTTIPTAEATGVAEVAAMTTEEAKAAAPAQPDEVDTATPEPTDTPQAVSVVGAESGGAAQPAAAPAENERTQDNDDSAGALLTVGIGALLAAVVVGVILLVLLARRRTTI